MPTPMIETNINKSRGKMSPSNVCVAMNPGSFNLFCKKYVAPSVTKREDQLSAPKVNDPIIDLTGKEYISNPKKCAVYISIAFGSKPVWGTRVKCTQPKVRGMVIANAIIQPIAINRWAIPFLLPRLIIKL